MVPFRLSHAIAIAAALAAPSALPAAINASFAGNTLNVEVTAPDSLTLSVVGGVVKFNGADASTGPVLAGDVGVMTLRWQSPGMSHDVSAVTAAEFAGVFSVEHYFTEDGQSVTGSEIRQFIFTSSANCSATGGPGDDGVTILPGGTGFTFQGNGGADIGYLRGTSGADQVLVQDAAGGGLEVLLGGISLLEATGLHRLDFELGDGDDVFSVSAGSTFTLQGIRLDPGPGDDSLDFNAATSQVIYDRFLATGDDMITAPSDSAVPMFIQLQVYDAVMGMTIMQSNGASTQQVQISGGLAGSVSYDRATSVLIYSGSGPDIFQFPDTGGFGLERVSVFGNDGDDHFEAALSPSVMFSFDGGGETSSDSATIDRNGFDPANNGGTVSAPGAQDIILNNVESISFVGATPTPSPTPTTTPSPTASPSPSPTPTATMTVTPTALPTSSPTATAVVTPTQTPAPSPTSTPAGTPTPSATPTTTSTATATPSPTPTATPATPVLGMLLGEVPGSLAADLNTDGIVDAADLVE